MAKSPSHRFGQIIGDLLEAALLEPLQKIADEFGLYLDYKRLRSARKGKKLTWNDRRGNTHDLDYVLEDGGSETVIGRPRAFIETAWRSYTKHSRNKAQEVQGAIQPLAETYCDDRPFLGVVLAGRFTRGSLDQLKSNNFQILFYSYETVVKIFRRVGIDAGFDEDTPDTTMQEKVDAFDRLTGREKDGLVRSFRRTQQRELSIFLDSLRAVLRRSIQLIFIVTLHGKTTNVATIEDAIAFVQGYNEASVDGTFVKYEINIRYSNGEEIRGQLKEKAAAIDFLRKFISDDRPRQHFSDSH
jgi:hypothetical protein